MSPRGSVLLIDDEAVVCAAVERVLSGAGLEVAIAADGGSGLAHEAARTCDLVLCDLVLPDRSGIDVVRELHRQRPELPILVITGYASNDAMRRAAGAGARSFLAKPFDDGELLEAVRHALEAHQPGSAVREEP